MGIDSIGRNVEGLILQASSKTGDRKEARKMVFSAHFVEIFSF